MFQQIMFSNTSGWDEDIILVPHRKPIVFISMDILHHRVGLECCIPADMIGIFPIVCVSLAYIVLLSSMVRKFFYICLSQENIKKLDNKKAIKMLI